MSEVENLINDQRKEIEALKLRVLELEEDVIDFERLAITWKKGCDDMEASYKRKLGNAEQTIKQLGEELKD